MPLTLKSYLLSRQLLLGIVLFFAGSIISVSAIAQVNVSFTSDKDGGCAPFSVQFTNSSTGVSANAMYYWDFGNGNSSDLPNPASIYTETKVYTVTLKVTDAGKTYTYSKDITGYKKPTADFSVSATKACIPAVINFTSKSLPGSGDVTRFYWDFGDGTTQEATAETAHTYMFLQKPSVTLTVTNSYGCNNSVTKDKIAEILPSIQSSFTSDKQVLCKTSDAVQFSNTSSGPGTLSYSWDFGDGNTSTAKNPSNSFNKKGVYTVSLTVKNTDGCSVTNTQSDYLNVASYKAGFDVPALICKDVPVNFTRTSTPAPTSTVWYVDGQQVNYWDAYLNTAFNTTGDHDIKIENTFGTCTDSYSTKVNIKPTPEMSEFTMDVQANCGPPAVVKFKDNTAGAVKWEWNFNWYGNNDNFTSFVQAPSFTYSSEGGYTTLLRVTNVYGCSNTIAQSVYISKPFANIGNILNVDETTEYCGYKKVQMSVTGSSEEIITYKWYLGDGTTSAEKQPIKEYITPGSYHVYLEYTTKSGCKGVSNAVDFSVYKKPKADFTASPGTTICGNTPMSFVYTGTGPYTYTNWYLDGQYVANGGSQIVFNEEKIYDAMLYVYNGNCGDTLIKNQYITVKLPFPAITGALNTCDGTRGEVAFTQASKGATSIIWDFGDGSATVTTPGDQLDIKHMYTKTGQFPVVLTAINAACSVKTSITAYVLLKQNPALTANKTAVCPDELLTIKVANYEKNPWVIGSYNHFSMQFQYEDASAFTGSTNPLNNNWYWTNEFNGTLQGFQSMKQKIRVITTSYGAGCSDTSNFIPLTIKGAAAAFDVVKDKQCYNSPVTLKDVSVANNNTITSWKWDFGDGQSQSATQGGNVSHTYDNPGQYNVQLTITDAGGCSSTSPPYSKTVEVYGPKAAFGVSGTNVPLNSTIQFYNYTNAYGSDNTQYTWDFGDGTKGINANEEHTYTQPGTYIVKLTAKDAVTGCTSEAPAQTIVVRYFNSAFQYSTSFVTSSNCAPVLAQFTNTSYDYTRIIWDFGDGYTLEDVNYAGHVYKTPGTYIVTLFVYGYNGLKGQYTDTVVINQPAANLKVDPDALCKGQSANLLASGKKISSYAWDFGDGNVQMSNDSTIAHIYNSTGTYTPQLLITDENGCTAAANAGDDITIRRNQQ
ncbi:MAG: PKD domain-containing protein [Agriterribacter sp.]